MALKEIKIKIPDYLKDEDVIEAIVNHVKAHIIEKHRKTAFDNVQDAMMEELNIFLDANK